MMKRIAQLRNFSNTWITDISPMALKNLEENISKSMKFTIHWNGEYGYEIEEGPYKKHIVSMDNLSCSCRAWQLRGIPCQHAIIAMHFKRLEPIRYIAHRYTKETYLKTYSHFIQPMNSMDMWPQSKNLPLAPPEIKPMPGRPKKLRRKEVTESRKIGKLSRCGGQVTCSLCKANGHNKRGCPHAEGSTSVVVAATTTIAALSIVSAPASPIDVVATLASVPYAGRGRERGRGRGSAPPTAAASSSCGSTSISRRGRGKKSAPPTDSSSMPYVDSTSAFVRRRTR